MRARSSVIVCLLFLVLAAVPSCASTSADSLAPGDADDGLRTATFAGGCFWCMEQPLEALDGVESVVSGFTGGDEVDPSYHEVLFGDTGHYEAVQVTYDPKRMSYERLLEVYWRQIDPTDDGGQFADRGLHYRTVIFYHDQTQKKLAEQSKRQLEDSGKFDKPIVTQILPYKVFYEAEDPHQDYYSTYPGIYDAYKKGSGREAFLKENWPEEGD